MWGKTSIKIFKPENTKYYVEIHEVDIPFENMYEFWLCHEEVGIKMLMEGINKEDLDTEEKMQDYIEYDLNEFINLYEEEFMENMPL